MFLCFSSTVLTKSYICIYILFFQWWSKIFSKLSHRTLTCHLDVCIRDPQVRSLCWLTTLIFYCCCDNTDFLSDISGGQKSNVGLWGLEHSAFLLQAPGRNVSYVASGGHLHSSAGISFAHLHSQQRCISLCLSLLLLRTLVITAGPLNNLWLAILIPCTTLVSAFTIFVQPLFSLPHLSISYYWTFKLFLIFYYDI